MVKTTELPLQASLDYKVGLSKRRKEKHERRQQSGGGPVWKVQPFLRMAPRGSDTPVLSPQEWN